MTQTKTYSRGETGVLMDTITVFMSQNGVNVFIELKTTMDEETVIARSFSMKREKFRELIADVI